MESKIRQSSLKSEEVNFRPRSDVIVNGTPNMELQPETIARAISEEMSQSGMTAGHRINLSMTVKQYLKHRERGSGLIRSILI